ncbi:cobaltochelatase subunit CobN [Leptolyngbya sp. BC1307]|uniref:cobaltochelatase subunit CobN n=1 Tax=Leptolyngbya sp. BC1307 TaxID=2029589 RepID=UPI000EFDAEE4|nr:cobaltochelatase subunit CobN [Leptolyngbya sp. BC1307]
MHRLAATPGGWDSSAEGVVFIEQTPAPIVVLTAADTDISALSQALTGLPVGFSDLRSLNLLQLQQQLTIDTYADTVLRHAQLIVLRVLGGRAYWSYGLEVVKAIAAETGAALVVMPGDDRPDLDLMGHSTVPLAVVNQLWQYFTEGGVNNLRNGLLYISDRTLATHYQPPVPQRIPRIGTFATSEIENDPLFSSGSSLQSIEKTRFSKQLNEQILSSQQNHLPALVGAKVGILFYRAHYLSGNTKVIEAIAAALAQRGLQPVPIYVSSLKETEIQQSLLHYCQADSDRPIELLINTTSFAVANLTQPAAGATAFDLWQALDIPVLQAICSGSPREQWQNHPQGLTPRDIAMNVALPEVDGRIITRAVSFKAAQTAAGSKLQTDVVMYEPEGDRVAFVADLAARWIRLRRTSPENRKIALVLANYPNRDGRIANGVGLDTPASCLNILQALKQAGYTVGDLPKTGDDLMAQLAQGVTNDPESYGLRPSHQTLSEANYQAFFDTLPAAVKRGVTQRWGTAAAEWQRFSAGAPGLSERSALPISGLQFGNIFVGIQPSRGYDLDPSLNYHAPDLEPTHAYLGFYHWLRHHFAADAVVHVGKHGNLEWLPGKGIALSAQCYPEAAFGPMPHFYPFIVNDPGEGAQAKRRSQAVILDHLTPPMTRAELYGPLQQLESLVDEYYEAQNLDPTRLLIIADKIITLLNNTDLQQDLNLTAAPQAQSDHLQTWLPQIDGYLCELKEAQIRDGLHIYGQCPEGRQLRDLIVAIARHPSSAPSSAHMGLSRAIAQAWQLDLDPLTADLSEPWPAKTPPDCRTVGDVVERIEQQAATYIGTLLASPLLSSPLPLPLQPVLTWVTHTLIPNLTRTTDEITHLLHGLNGGYIPSGPSGAPTRNRPEVLPTGRNFYSVDIRAIPTESAWDVGRKAAEILVENYTQENGEYPRTLGLSMWGTAAMRTGGDDMAEALALLGVRPVWDGPSRRVVDFEILPVSLLGRPRVDVTLRISGFFRDAFPNLISLFDQAVNAVSALDEPPEQNPLAAQVQRDYAHWQQQGLNDQQSLERSRYRIFGSKPGAYGAGLQGLIEAQNWESDADLARAYINWSGYAYTGQADGHSASEAFSQRLSQMQIVLQNQDNREHDLLDSDDYYQFQGGLTAAVKAQRGESPTTYFGDNAVPENPKVRSLKSEIARVYRSRVVNPKWIAGVMRHGYKGAFEMAATVDYLFAYDATTGCVENHMYEGVADAYVFDPAVRKFIEKSNPWALRDMAERLLEANQRGLWQGASEEKVDGLRAIAHTAEGQIEAGLSGIG